MLLRTYSGSISLPRARTASRSLRYSGRCLNQTRWILVTGDAVYLESYEGQVAALVACNMLSRMTPSVAVALPSVPIVAALPWEGQPLPI